MLTQVERDICVQTLLKAAKDRKQAVQLSTTYPGITIEDAYAISGGVTQARIKAGAKLVGHKVGLTSKAMQASSQIDEPDFGYLLDDNLVENGAKLKHADFCVPRVEAELTFVLKKPLKGPGIGLIDVLRATEYVVPSIEVIDARVLNPRKIYDTVSDNGAAASLIMGGRPVGPDELDLRWVGALMYRNTEIEETGLAAGVLGHPAMGVAWLANKLGSLGTPLEAGHLVLSGSFIRPVFANKGDTLHADFGPLGTVSCQFV
jgi:2-oxo-hept-3-ene-1,7-dioate hydratase